MPGTGPSFTFAVIGRDESATLAGVIEEARRAALPADHVWFVDSASSDDSAQAARSLGVEVIEAPAGKGRAIAAALACCQTRYICFVDADLFEWTVNIPATLREAMLASGADMVVGCFRDDRRRVMQPYLYWPLVDALLPDLGRRCDPTPLSGQRVLDPRLVRGPLPSGYGIETHLNLSLAAAGHRIETCDLGELRGQLRGYANLNAMAHDVAAAILDSAVAAGRLDPELRADYERWVADLIEVLGSAPPPGAPDQQYLAELEALAARPMPPAIAAPAP